MSGIAFFIFQLVVLIFSVMIHEISHGAVAYQLGDPTAKNAGRLTLNPLKHLDPVGSVILPLSLFLLSGGTFIIGWAKPVPYNPLNLKNPRTGSALIGMAGPLSNFAIAIIFAGLIQLLTPLGGIETIGLVTLLFHAVVILNILLAVFNLLPMPPLDGASVLFALLPEKYNAIRRFLIQYGFYILILFILFGFPVITPIIYWFYRILVGNSIF